MKSKMKFNACAILASLLTLCALTGCANVSREKSDLRVLYQPPLIRLQAGQTVQTTDGLYTPQVDEVWHSDARFRSVEQGYLDAANALRTYKK